MGINNAMDFKTLVVVDASYCAYFCTHSAVKRWMENYYAMGLEDIVLPEPGSVPYEDLPDLTRDTKHFNRVLMEVAREKIEGINNIVFNVTGHFYTSASDNSPVDTIIARDSHSGQSFRRMLFPEYKMQRNAQRASRNQFNHVKIFDYLYSVVYPEVFPRNSHVIMVAAAEGDDIIASAIQSEELRKRYANTILISSDHDFCQLHRKENHLRQFTLKGEEVLCELQLTRSGRKVSMPITSDEALLIKIITGDTSDNIKGIKKKLGPVGAYKLVCEGDARKNLKELFTQDAEAQMTFQLNRKLIDFREMPEDLHNEIIKAIMKEFG